MDILDPNFARHQRIRLILSYVLAGLIIAVIGFLLLLKTDGFGINNKGQIVQSGLIFTASQPSGAEIYVNGKDAGKSTNTRLTLVSGNYRISYYRSGYRNWQRWLNLGGGVVDHLDYALLIPNKLTTNIVQKFTAAPDFVTESPDGHWLLVGGAGTSKFYLYDLTNPTNLPTSFSLSKLLPEAASERLKFVQWADDSTHVLLESSAAGRADEYLMVDTQDPSQSVDLNAVLKVKIDKLTLQNQKYDQYFIYQNAGHKLLTASLSSPTPQLFIRDALAYKTYGGNMALYVSAIDAPPGKVNVKLFSGGKNYVLEQLPAGTNYVLNLATYSGTWYMAIGAASEHQVSVFQDPLGQLSSNPGQPLTPLAIFKINNPNYVAFSNNARYVMAEGGQQFGVYDFEDSQNYTYTVNAPLDKPQLHATWLDNDHLYYVSGGKLLIFDNDGSNQQKLMPANANFEVALTPDQKLLYAVSPEETPTGAVNLTSTDLLIPSDR